MLGSILHKRVSPLLNQVACSKAMPAQPEQVLSTAAGSTAYRKHCAPKKQNVSQNNSHLGVNAEVYGTSNATEAVQLGRGATVQSVSTGRGPGAGMRDREKTE